MASYQTPQDEGYSEDPLTMQLSGGGRRAVTEADVYGWLSELPAAERARMFNKGHPRRRLGWFANGINQ